MGNQCDTYEYQTKDIHGRCGYVRGSMGCEAAHRPKTKTMRCAYCRRDLPWTTPGVNTTTWRFEGGGEFPSRIYAECWRCWEATLLRDAKAWAARHRWWKIRRPWGAR